MIDQLPKTFIDAIKVASLLGVHYIWIDALTIIQDSSDDWAKEASRMGDVYKYSFINIGATASTDSHGGLFFERDPALVNPCTYTLDHINYLLIDRNQWDSSVELAPLLQRGWVVQERVLCTRMLHFGQDQLFWECRTSAGCEVAPEIGPDQLESRVLLSSLKANDELAAGENKIEKEPNHIDKPCRLLRQWHSIVGNYSGSTLTFKSDKLIAISGMAEAFQRQLGDDYVAGMWKADLIRELAWGCIVTPVVPRENAIQVSEQYVAPSWSWASVHRDISFTESSSAIQNPEAIHMFAEILEVSLNYKSSNAFAQLTGGFIRMRAPLNEVSVRMNTFGLYGYLSYVLSYGKAGSSIACDPYNVVLDNDNNTESLEEKLLCLLLYIEKQQTGRAGTIIPEMRALLLRRASGTAIRFERMGIMRISDKYAIKHFSSVERLDALPDELFHPERGYTIEII
jgi:hypothetical protein